MQQQDITHMFDKAAMEYKKTTPPKDHTFEGVQKVMNVAAIAKVKSIKSKDFHKYLILANPDINQEFFDEVHNCNNLSTMFLTLD